MAEQWYKIKNRETGEEEIVASLGGIDLDVWEVIPIKGSKPPSEFDVVLADGTVQVDQARKEQADKVCQLRSMTQDQLYCYILELESRIAALEAKAQ